MDGACSVLGRDKKYILVIKPEGKRLLGRPRCRWENIKMDLGEIGLEGVDWIYVAWDRGQCQALVNTVMNHKRRKI
jgi:hypothetical protein